MKLHKLTAVISTFIILALSFTQIVYAEEETLKLTQEEAIGRALEYTTKLNELDKNINDLWKQRNEALEYGVLIQEQLDLLKDYEKLYNKRENGEILNYEESNKLSIYVEMFGPKPLVISSEEMFNNYIKNRDFPHYSLWGMIKNMELNREVLKLSIENAVYEMYKNIINLNETVILQEELYNTMLNQSKDLEARYKLGQSSELEKYLSDIKLEEQRVAVLKIRRNVDNLEMSFKQQLGIPLTQKIELIYEDKYNRTAKTYEEYLEAAIENRAEVLTAKTDREVKQRELGIMKSYVKNELLTERREAQLSVDEKDVALREAIENVTADVYEGYSAVTLKLKDVLISKQKLGNAEKQFKQVKIQYDMGVIPISVLWDMQISIIQNKLSYNSAIRELDNTIRKLELASGNGPGYRAAIGGNF